MKKVVLLIDKSASMNIQDCDGKTRLDVAKSIAEKIARESENISEGGVDVVVFSGFTEVHEGVTTATELSDILKNLSPGGVKDTAAALALVLEKQSSIKKEDRKQLVVGIITDGIPVNKVALMHRIMEHTQVIESKEDTSILFLQVGKDDAASNFFKTLDNDLVNLGAKFDIVATMTEQELAEAAEAEAKAKQEAADADAKAKQEAADADAKAKQEAADAETKKNAEIQ